ncbi:MULTISPECIES: fimbrial protein [Providencia]|uniref:fimbrial protein n=1 Tax=Providencia TaxID=586 RepID=UPI00201D2FBD|nr:MULTISPECIES: fimbrial protein [Providencia]EMA4784641.1 fimbrial protein [Providencia rettgeri]EMB3084692.1 fimbrial protein [Providencia rettgeri]MDU7496016.1 fimbrial protein [Providencia rettgeri]UQZ14256.1 fimbrial protein [Providencia stuartii]HEM8139274.1 fimbrial protein [Providencia rettgeri]
MKKCIKKQYMPFISAVIISVMAFFINVGTSIASNDVKINMTGNLLDFPPCDVYSSDGVGSPIHIHFNEIGIQRIDGNRFKQNWILKVSCDGTLGANVPIELKYNGEDSGFDTQALVTDKPGLGIRLYRSDNGSVVELNKPYTLVMSKGGKLDIPLYSVPVKGGKSVLSAGQFTASATLELNYP